MLYEVPKGRGGTLERAIRLRFGFGDVGEMRDVAGHVHSLKRTGSETDLGPFIR